MYLNLSRFTSEVPIPTISAGVRKGSRVRETKNVLTGGRASVGTHHVRPVHRRGHLHLPEVLALCELLGAADGRGAGAVVQVEAHLPVATAEEGS